MKKSIFTLVTMIVLGTGVMNGKTKVIIIEDNKPQKEQVMNHKHHKHHKKHKKAVVPKREVTVSKQTIRF